MHPQGKVTLPVCRSTTVEQKISSSSPNVSHTVAHDIHIHPSLGFPNFSRQICIDLQQGWQMEEEEGPEATSSAVRDSHAPPLHSVSDGYGLISILSIGPSQFSNL